LPEATVARVIARSGHDMILRFSDPETRHDFEASTCCPSFHYGFNLLSIINESPERSDARVSRDRV
jgi:hypothetical protein